MMKRPPAQVTQNKRPLTVEEAGRLGGNKILREYGRDHFRKLARQRQQRGKHNASQKS